MYVSVCKYCICVYAYMHRFYTSAWIWECLHGLMNIYIYMNLHLWVVVHFMLSLNFKIYSNNGALCLVYSPSKNRTVSNQSATNPMYGCKVEFAMVRPNGITGRPSLFSQDPLFLEEAALRQKFSFIGPSLYLILSLLSFSLCLLLTLPVYTLASATIPLKKREKRLTRHLNLKHI